MPTHDYVPHAPGYVDNDGPKIVTGHRGRLQPGRTAA